MNSEVALASIRQGDLSANEAWKLLSPLVNTEDAQLAGRIGEALRAWTWKALDRRRRDPGLREWVDVLNRVETFFVDRFAEVATRVELLAEFLHESLSVADLISNDDLISRKHISSIMVTLSQRNGDWIERSEFMKLLRLKPANTTRVMSLLVDMGFVEQINIGREVSYRISSEGALQASKLSRLPKPQIEQINDTSDWIKETRSFVKITMPHALFHMNDAQQTIIEKDEEEWERIDFEAASLMKVEDERYLETYIDHVPMPKFVIAGANR